ncbi:uncharacterized protein PHACADRAFT_185271 [Phanerochaete carnosa HHB-10118-sp]|uniref:Phytanoyl-CoA dioxygenase n=1 Tax=Phanerochaete carnosa (strain HHB-10118-sp) TaxID=650164 RepID=K5W5V8_PHACS|nr:uncharacterized protein PHACADRAFT_185271 [Phanerochaete carnosa HHB-10118-sp]EKM54329.1 hypothetical protein PHACADRAFT_185271 [Phanerochaete carnosa HHB-10118-sp]
MAIGDTGLQYLSQEQVDQFYRDGYLRLPNFLSPEDTEALLTRSRQLLANFSLEDHPLVRLHSLVLVLCRQLTSAGPCWYADEVYNWRRQSRWG